MERIELLLKPYWTIWAIAEREVKRNSYWPCKDIALPVLHRKGTQYGHKSFSRQTINNQEDYQEYPNMNAPGWVVELSTRLPADVKPSWQSGPDSFALSSSSEPIYVRMTRILRIHGGR